ncbi:hypothetical protein WR25_10978 [Diploscapter pachys]|uniref:Uncharacterized protein n=1 Tax=Diploscapter pachys TaxID=2018661 RepID=A0A2A2M586_9BILA|nr:hypothetical protein WR25_10978 [Diploscapter pachys]
MDTTDLARVLDRLNRTQAPRGADRAHVGKVRALWWTLYWLGAIDQPDDRAIGLGNARRRGLADAGRSDRRPPRRCDRDRRPHRSRHPGRYDAARDPAR